MKVETYGMKKNIQTSIWETNNSKTKSELKFPTTPNRNRRLNWIS